MSDPPEWSTGTQDLIEAIRLTQDLTDLQQQIKEASDKRRWHLRRALGSHSRQFVAQKLGISAQRLAQLVGKSLPGERFE